MFAIRKETKASESSDAMTLMSKEENRCFMMTMVKERDGPSSSEKFLLPRKIKGCRTRSKRGSSGKNEGRKKMAMTSSSSKSPLTSEILRIKSAGLRSGLGFL